MKKTILLAFITAIQGFYSQTGKVGINTETPKATLHVYGSTRVDNAIHIGGDVKTLGEAGNPGDFLVSQGPNKPPVWKSPVKIGIPEVAILTEQVEGNIISGKGHGWTNIPLPKNETFKYSNSNYIEATNDNKIKIKKGGYYQVDAYVLMIEIPSGDGTKDTDFGGTLSLNLRARSGNQTIAGLISSVGTPSGKNNHGARRESVSGVIKIPDDSVIDFSYAYTRDSKLLYSGISMIYLSE